MNLTIVFDLLSIASYILLALGMYTMAKRRGIRKPWLAWIPVANVWLLGCLSDQYQYVSLGRQRGRRKTMLTLEIVILVVSVAVGTIFAIWLMGLWKLLSESLSVETLIQLTKMTEEEIVQWGMNQLQNAPGVMKYLMDSIGTVMIGAFLALALAALAIWLSVLQYMAYYDVFRSSDPRNAALYLVLGIVLNMVGGGFLLALFVFISREKDFGMPPRQEEMPEVPVWTPPVQENL